MGSGGPTYCVYCGRVTSWNCGFREAEEKGLLAEHAPGCRWVETKGHPGPASIEEVFEDAADADALYQELRDVVTRVLGIDPEEDENAEEDFPALTARTRRLAARARTGD